MRLANILGVVNGDVWTKTTFSLAMVTTKSFPAKDENEESQKELLFVVENRGALPADRWPT